MGPIEDDATNRDSLAALIAVTLLTVIVLQSGVIGLLDDFDEFVYRRFAQWFGPAVLGTKASTTEELAIDNRHRSGSISGNFATIGIGVEGGAVCECRDGPAIGIRRVSRTIRMAPDLASVGVLRMGPTVVVSPSLAPIGIFRVGHPVGVNPYVPTVLKSGLPEAIGKRIDHSPVRHRDFLST